MLKALYTYAQRKHLTLPPGYINKTVKAYIVLSSSNPDNVTLHLGDDREIPCQGRIVTTSQVL